MCKKRIVPVCLNTELLKFVDEQVVKESANNKKGRKFNRSAFIESALDYYLKIKCGIPYLVYRK